MSGLFLCHQMLLAVAIVVPFTTLAHAFTFTNTNPSQCDDLTVSWSGGEPPFRLLIIPPGQPVRNFSIPSTAFQNGAGSFTTQLLFSQNQRIMLSISDATGITTGGISSLLTVGPTVSGNSCNTTSPSPDFFFSLDTDLEECKTYPFTSYSGAIQPVTIFGYVTSGQSFKLTPPIGDTFTWKNNLTAGTPISFSMQDSRGRDGGTSDIRVVKLSGDKSCLNSSTAPPSPSSSSPPSNSSSSSKSLSTGALVGIAIGAVAVIALLVVLAFLFWRKRRAATNRMQNSHEKPDLVYNPLARGSPPPGNYSEAISNQYTLTPFYPPTTEPARLSQKAQLMESLSSRPSHTSLSTSPMFSEFGSDQSRPQPGSSLGGHTQLVRPGSSQGSSAHQQRVIVHTDITDTNDEPLELPPQYSDARAPIPGLPSSSHASEPSSSEAPSRPRKS